MIVRDLPVGSINIESKEVKVINQVNFTCQSSTECCRKHDIPVTPKEVERITDNGFEPDQFLINFTPILINSKTGKSKIKAYVLKKKPFSHDCVFLNEKNLCSIHEFKPFACKIYPFTYEIKDTENIEVRVHQDSVCSSVSVGLNAPSDSINIIRDVYSKVKML